MPEITLLLHNIRSTHNVGSIFRSAEGFGVKQIILTGYTPYPKQPNDPRLPHISEKLTKQIHKSALGAELLVPFRWYEEVANFLSENTLPLVALEQAHDSLELRSFTPPNAFVLIVGEEVNGIPSELLAACQNVVEIPMHGQKESFNVSVAAGIALYALLSPR